jgi:hypothetical protein
VRSLRRLPHHQAIVLRLLCKIFLPLPRMKTSAARFNARLSCRLVSHGASVQSYAAFSLSIDIFFANFHYVVVS